MDVLTSRYNLMDILYSSSDPEGDEGSKPRCARVLAQGVSAYGIIDTTADIIIIGGNLFQKVAKGRFY